MQFCEVLLKLREDVRQANGGGIAVDDELAKNDVLWTPVISTVCRSGMRLGDTD